MIYTAFVFGLLGSLHCIGMCGPIAFLLPLDRKSKTNRFFEVLSYHSGRLLTYGFFGFVFGMLGERLQLFGLQQQLSIVLGILMIVVILAPRRFLVGNHFSRPIYSWVSKIRSAMGLRLKQKEAGTFFTLGCLNGMLPCGLVYMAIFASLGMGDMWYGGLYMVLFGLGTVPLMTAAMYLGSFLKESARKRIIAFVPAMVILVGLLFVLRGLGLGIPYLSPSEDVADVHITSTHSCH